MNGAGIVIGETTVAQTPWNPDGAPMSDRIRRAVQYGTSIDEVVAILAERNNGLYTNDWPMADVKTGEAAICLLGTDKTKLWRSGDAEAPFGTPGFLWANNNPRDPEVRSEYAVQPSGAPFDPVFAPWNRDLAFNAYYQREKGRIDVPSVARLFATSPINLAHACDGKITTSEMAEKLVFWAHQGKVTLREKFPAKGNRRMPDLPGARPHLTLGYTAVTPDLAGREARRGEGRRALRAVREEGRDAQARRGQGQGPARRRGQAALAGDALPAERRRPLARQRHRRLLADPARPAGGRGQGGRRPWPTRWPARTCCCWPRWRARPTCRRAQAERSYTRYAPYRVARVKGTFALHQLRLQLGTSRS